MPEILPGLTFVSLCRRRIFATCYYENVDIVFIEIYRIHPEVPSPHFSLLSSTSPSELPEREVTSPSFI